MRVYVYANNNSRLGVLYVVDQVEIISSRGYPVEVHTVVTDDGYILEVHRIPHGKGQSTDTSTPLGKPVFLQHGFSTSDADWLISPSDRSLGKSSLPFKQCIILYSIII